MFPDKYFIFNQNISTLLRLFWLAHIKNNSLEPSKYKNPFYEYHNSNQSTLVNVLTHITPFSNIKNKKHQKIFDCYNHYCEFIKTIAATTLKTSHKAKIKNVIESVPSLRNYNIYQLIDEYSKQITEIAISSILELPKGSTPNCSNIRNTNTKIQDRTLTYQIHFDINKLSCLQKLILTIQ